MELNEKTLRKFFLEAFDQVVMPRLESIENELAKKADKTDIDNVKDELKGDIDNVKDELKGDIDNVQDELKGDIRGVDMRLLDLEEKIIPELRSIQVEFKIVVNELEIMKRSGGSKFVLDKINDLEMLIAEKSRELLKFADQLKKFEKEIKILRQSKYKTVG
jgi:hypothetical protein